MWSTVTKHSLVIFVSVQRKYFVISLRKKIHFLFVSKSSIFKSNPTLAAKKRPDDVMGDVYDGNIWHTFKNLDGNKYVEAPHNLMLFLTVDWFQPITHLTDSLGAIYLSVQNIPRAERYKLANIILVGIIPGPKEPKNTMNQYLSHLVEELKEFWHGVEIPILNSASPVVVKLALTGMSCDLPAVRKVCGFASYSAILGCSKCLHKFKSGQFGQKLDYSGYDRTGWPVRTLSEHREMATKYLMAKSSAEKQSTIKTWSKVLFITGATLFWSNPFSCDWPHAQFIARNSKACYADLDKTWHTWLQKLCYNWREGQEHNNTKGYWKIATQNFF